MAATELLFEKKWICKSGISGIFYPDNPQCHKNHGGGWLPGVQNSFRCLAAENLCLAKNRIKIAKNA